MTDNQDGNAPAIDDDLNPFQLIAYLLFRLRVTLEEETPGRAPRWVRMARVREDYKRGEALAQAVPGAMGPISDGIVIIAEAILDLHEIMVQTDSIVAMTEAVLDFARGVVGSDFTDALNKLSLGGYGNPIPQSVIDTLDDLETYLGYIPEPNDLKALGHEIYRLLCIVQRPLPLQVSGGKLRVAVAEAVDPDQQLDLEATGKLRLLQYTFGKEMKARGLGTIEDPEGAEPLPFKRFGLRRLWQTDDVATLPYRVLGEFVRPTYRDTVVDTRFNHESDHEEFELNNKDLEEVHNILEALGYQNPPVADKQTFSPALSQRLVCFQALNGLPLTGMIDNDTINRLLNLDYHNQNLARARPFDPDLFPGQDEANPWPVMHPGYVQEDLAAGVVVAGDLELANADADKPREEGVDTLHTPPGYYYYVVGQRMPPGGAATLPEGRGWLRSHDSSLDPGFVALKSRDMLSPAEASNGAGERFDGGAFSEGESVSGRMFFAARCVEPWRASEAATPGSRALNTGDAPAPESHERTVRGRVHQWVDLQELMARKPADHDLRIDASVFLRALYKDDGDGNLIAAQGQLGVEFYGADAFSGDARMGAPRDLDKRIDKRYSAWHPMDDQTTVAPESPEQRQCKYLWTMRHIRELVVPESATGMAIVLEARHHAGFNTDAFFDSVRVRWEYRATIEDGGGD